MDVEMGAVLERLLIRTFLYSMISGQTGNTTDITCRIEHAIFNLRVLLVL